MIRYTVVWDTDVELAFMNSWIAGDSQLRSTLTEIANSVDRELAVSPDIKGRPRPELSARIVDVPLSDSSALVSATYHVLPDDRLVRVIQLVFRTR
jgi:hypothetical protein